MPSNYSVIARLTLALGFSTLLLGLLAVHDFFVAPAGRVLPASMTPLIFLGTGIVATGASLLILGSSTWTGSTRRFAIPGGVLLALGLLGLAWRTTAEQEAGFPGTVLFILLVPPGAVLSAVAAGLFVYRRLRGAKGSSRTGRAV